ncbi:MAG TPA: ABC transporter permease, partial [Noviherbaspirillum sp.]|nr:ABC transporter permease [Noviherbaspirillum sp.]
MRPVQLHALDLTIAAVLVVLDAAISIALGLRLHRRIFLSGLRMVIQLLLVGFVLRTVFAFTSPAAMIAIALLMITAAVREVAVRPVHALRGRTNYWIGAAVIGMSSITTVLLALLTAIRPSPWYDPRYALPILGIVLGSVLNSASLGLDTFFGS